MLLTAHGVHTNRKTCDTHTHTPSLDTGNATPRSPASTTINVPSVVVLSVRGVKGGAVSVEDPTLETTSTRLGPPIFHLRRSFVFLNLVSKVAIDHGQVSKVEQTSVNHCQAVCFFTRQGLHTTRKTCETHTQTQTHRHTHASSTRHWPRRHPPTGCWARSTTARSYRPTRRTAHTRRSAVRRPFRRRWRWQRREVAARG